MKHEEFIIDDRLIIPDYINNMTDEELDAFIAEREAAAAKKKALRTAKPLPSMRPTA